MATSVSQPGYFHLQEFTSAGALMAAGRLYFYTQGTTTKKDVYTESTGTTAHTLTSDGAGGEYLALDARGEAPAPIYMTSGAYDVCLKTAAGATVWTRQADPTGANLAASSGSASVGFLQSGPGAVARTVQSKERETFSVTDFGTITGTNDNTVVAAAFTAGAGKRIYFPPGTYAINDLTWPANTIFCGDGVTSIIKKRANGDLGTMGALSVCQDLDFDLNGTNFTGRGFVISTGAVDGNSWRKWIGCRFLDSYSYAIEFTADMAGYLSLAMDCIFTMSLAGPTPYATPAIKLPSVNETNGNRHFVRCVSGGFILIDFDGGENTNLTSCLMAPPLYGANSQKSSIVGGRIVTRSDSSAWTIRGSETIIVGNTIAQLLVTLDSTLDEAFIDGNSWAATTFTDNATGDTNDNKIYLPSFSYTPTWTAASVNPAIGNGQIFGSYVRRGEDCRVRMSLAPGSTTTFGTGDYTFTLPYSCADVTTGTAVALDASTGFLYNLHVITIAGTNQAKLTINGAGYMAPTAPVTWAQNDVMYFDLDFRIL